MLRQAVYACIYTVYYKLACSKDYTSKRKQQRNVYETMTRCYVGQDSDSLRAEHFGDPIPVGPDFSYPSRLVLGVYPFSCTRAPDLFPGVKRLGHFVYHPSQSSVEVKEYSCIATSPLNLRGLSRVNFTFFFFF